MSELIKFDRTMAVLAEYAQNVRDRYYTELEKSGRRASGELLSSISTVVVVGEQIIAVDMNLAEHWKWVENDTRPHWAPKGCLLDWIRMKPVLPTPRADGSLPTPEQLDYLIRRKIAAKGTEGSHDLEKSVKALNEAYIEKIADAMAEDFAEVPDIIIRSFAR